VCVIAADARHYWQHVLSLLVEYVLFRASSRSSLSKD
jgi:hypothetical protein